MLGKGTATHPILARDDGVGGAHSQGGSVLTGLADRGRPLSGRLCAEGPTGGARPSSLRPRSHDRNLPARRNRADRVRRSLAREAHALPPLLSYRGGFSSGVSSVRTFGGGCSRG